VCVGELVAAHNPFQHHLGEKWYIISDNSHNLVDFEAAHHFHLQQHTPLAYAMM
jgi:hypothetical protein